MFGLQDIETGEYYDTHDVTLQCVIKGPVFRGEDKADGSLVFNMTLPATDKNKRLLKFPLRIEGFELGVGSQESEVKERENIGWLNGQQIWTGTMLAKFARPGGIEVSIGMGRGEFNYQAEGKKIADVVPDEIHTIGSVGSETDMASGILHDVHDIDKLDDVPNFVYPDINYAVFPIKIDDMCRSLGPAYNNAYYNTTPCVNFWDMTQQRFSHPMLFGNFATLIQTESDANMNIIKRGYLLAYNIFMPLPYNGWVFKNLFATLGYFLENNPFDLDEDLRRLVLFNVQTINKLWNKYSNGGGNPSTDWYQYALEPELDFNLKDHLPPIAVKDYLRALEDLFFFRCFINNKTKRVKVLFLKDVVNSREYVDITHRVEAVKERKMEFDKISALVMTYDGADSNSGGLKARSEVDAMVRIPDVYFKDGLPLNDNGQYTNKICYASMEKKWYICSGYADDFTHTSTWEDFTFEYYMQKYIRATGKEWKTETSGIICSYFTDFKPGTSNTKYEWMIPYCKMGLKFYNAITSNDNTCGMRLLFYRGFVDGKVQTYSYADLAVLGTNSAGLTLWGFAAGILVTHWYLSQSAATDLLTYLSSVHTFTDAKNKIIAAYSDSHGGYVDMGSVMSFITQCLWIYPSWFLSSIDEWKYPYGTNDVYDAYGKKMPEANLSLKWDGECGIYNKLAKEFITYKNEIAKAVTIRFKPEVSDLFFDFSMKHRINGVDYLFDEIRLEIRPDGSMDVAEADAFSC